MKKKWLQLGLIDCLGFLCGMTFVLLPAASNMLTSPDHYNLSNYAYGLLFLPFVFAFLLAFSYLTPKANVKSTLAVGIGLIALALLFLTLSNTAPGKYPLNLCILVGVSAFLGAGVGLTWPALHSLAAHLDSIHRAFAPATLLASFGLGAACIPLLVSHFALQDLWWLAPITLFAGWVLLFNFAIFLPILSFPQAQDLPEKHTGVFNLSWTFWLFFTVVLLYGFCETALSNWIPIYMHSVKKLTFTEANLALASFWLMMTLGRVLIGFGTLLISFRWFYIFLPLAIFWALGIVPEVFSASDLIIACGIAGATCSAFLPLSMYFGQVVHPGNAASVSSGLLIAYMLGYGFGAYGVAELIHMSKIPLEATFFFASLPAAFMTILAWLILYFFPRQKPEKGDGS